MLPWGGVDTNCRGNVEANRKARYSRNSGQERPNAFWCSTVTSDQVIRTSWPRVLAEELHYGEEVLKTDILRSTRIRGTRESLNHTGSVT